ncbi:hypothetical protein LR48_Vigan773s000200 [Vigna angularis]|uniref:histidinol-phosphate transaminase n=1 Tax=Phaseolus angularis TaxID=3914 RepID=A0A0L9TH43_PHAAN|nr:hypothetical protein LR48_Vigan773s000200 [Vigna angularis]
MGVIDFYNSAALCWVKSNTNLKQQVGLPLKPICPFEGNQRKFVAIASTIPVEQVNNGPLLVTGDSFIREHLRKLSPYQPILPFEVLSARLGQKPEDIVKLDANENPYGPPPEVMEALGSIKFPYVYPDPESRRLRAALAEESGLEAEYILVGCGADELIDLIIRCVLDPGDKIVDCPPTFTMYEFDAAVNGALVIKVPRKPDFSLNGEQIAEVVKQEKPKCIFLTSPNNPDGSIIDDDVLLKILDLPILVILDEAYIEFSAIESRMSWVKKHENLIVLRTFSKRAVVVSLSFLPLALLSVVAATVCYRYPPSLLSNVAFSGKVKCKVCLEKRNPTLVVPSLEAFALAATCHFSSTSLGRVFRTRRLPSVDRLARAS